MRKVSIVIAGILLTPLILYISFGAMLWLLGYEFAEGPDALAKKLVNESRPAKDCFLYVTLDPWFRPTTRELRNQCIHEYAKLTHDTSACELLMPGAYGWSCVGGAQDKEPCLFDFKKEPEVRGNGIIVPLSQCLHGNATTQNNTCCAIARIAFFDAMKECSSLTAAQKFIDQCYHETAKKKNDMEPCLKIVNANIRSACLVQVRALHAN